MQAHTGNGFQQQTMLSQYEAPNLYKCIKIPYCFGSNERRTV